MKTHVLFAVLFISALLFTLGCDNPSSKSTNNTNNQTSSDICAGVDGTADYTWTEGSEIAISLNGTSIEAGTGVTGTPMILQKIFRPLRGGQPGYGKRGPYGTVLRCGLTP
ncbi:MAG: hypothetical protein CVU65_11710 [Deltaproteobacteria bacterium HGW-Deltaproteobacteria-22]|jgi:hypothetical protein|nr:MAG: hypothetical protein CVU65_11710 [Deltaproteobacteria bacterium HGW-Deltaproteobacteria-22]